MAATVPRTHWIDDDGSGTTGTVINDAEKQKLYTEIDAGLAAVSLTDLMVPGYAGDLYEKGRTTPVGHWVDIPFSAANFSATGGGTWTVGAAAIVSNRYGLIGKTCLWSIYISWFSGANMLAGTITSLQITAPVYPTQPIGNAVGFVTDTSGVFYATFSSGQVSLQKIAGGNIPPGVAFGLITTFTFEA